MEFSFGAWLVIFSAEASQPKITGWNKKGQHTLAGWWFQPTWKILVKMGIFPNFRGENKEYLSCHHLDNLGVCETKNFREMVWNKNTNYINGNNNWYMNGVFLPRATLHHQTSVFKGSQLFDWRTAGNDFHQFLITEPISMISAYETDMCKQKYRYTYIALLYYISELRDSTSCT